MPPPNDAFANAIVLSAPTDSESGTTVAATRQAGTNEDFWYVDGHTVWYRYTTTEDNERIRLTVSAAQDHWLVVFNDDLGSTIDDVIDGYVTDDGFDTDFVVQFISPAAGITYYFWLDSTSGTPSSFTLDFEVVDPSGPTGDSCGGGTWAFRHYHLELEAPPYYITTPDPAGFYSYRLDMDVAGGAMLGDGDGTRFYEFGAKWHDTAFTNGDPSNSFLHGGGPGLFRAFRIYDAGADTWSDGTYPDFDLYPGGSVPPEEVVYSPTAAKVVEDKFVVVTRAVTEQKFAGIFPSFQVLVYDIGGDSWTLGTAPSEVGGAAAVVGGDLYLAGATSGGFGGGTSLWRYRVATDSWTSLSSAPEPIVISSGLGAVGIAERGVAGEIHVVNRAGFDDFDPAHYLVYDVDGDSWTDVGPMPTTDDRDNLWQPGESAVWWDGSHVWMTSGANLGFGVPSGYSDIVAQYDPDADTWCFGPHVTINDRVGANLGVGWNAGLVSTGHLLVASAPAGAFVFGDFPAGTPSYDVPEAAPNPFVRHYGDHGVVLLGTGLVGYWDG